MGQSCMLELVTMMSQRQQELAVHGTSPRVLHRVMDVTTPAGAGSAWDPARAGV